MKKRIKYYYVVSFYGYEESGVLKNSFMSTLCRSTENDPVGLPTTGALIKYAYDRCVQRGWKYVENSLVVLSINRITKDEFDRLNDRREPDGDVIYD